MEFAFHGKLQQTQGDSREGEDRVFLDLTSRAVSVAGKTQRLKSLWMMGPERALTVT